MKVSKNHSKVCEEELCTTQIKSNYYCNRVKSISIPKNKSQVNIIPLDHNAFKTIAMRFGPKRDNFFDKIISLLFLS